MNELPNDYTPKALRPAEKEERQEVKYFAAYEMSAGTPVHKPKYQPLMSKPVADLQFCLECIPDSVGTLLGRIKADTAVIVRQKLDGTDEVIYRWFRPPNGTPCWKKQVKE